KKTPRATFEARQLGLKGACRRRAVKAVGIALVAAPAAGFIGRCILKDDRLSTMHAYPERCKTLCRDVWREDALGEIVHGRTFPEKRRTLTETNSETSILALLLFF